jgi:hypothetical protein
MAQGMRQGLCGKCLNARQIKLAKGISVHSLLSAKDPRFPKYPRFQSSVVPALLRK